MRAPCARSMPVIHLMMVMVWLATARSRSALVTSFDVSNSFNTSVIPSACVREKPRCSSFFTTPFVSITNVCIYDHCTMHVAYSNPVGREQCRSEKSLVRVDAVRPISP